jgi:hypothetical protein
MESKYDSGIFNTGHSPMEKKSQQSHQSSHLWLNNYWQLSAHWSHSDELRELVLTANS